VKAAFEFDSICREIHWGVACFPAGPLERLFEEGIQGGFKGRGPLQTFKKE